MRDESERWIWETNMRDEYERWICQRGLSFWFIISKSISFYVQLSDHQFISLLLSLWILHEPQVGWKKFLHTFIPNASSVTYFFLIWSYLILSYLIISHLISSNFILFYHILLHLVCPHILLPHFISYSLIFFSSSLI